MCLFMLGVFDTSGIASSRSKRPDAYIDAAPFPRRQEQLHNNPLTCPRPRRAFAGRWKLCVVILVPAERRLDVLSLTTFWRTRARTLERRILYGVRLARALQLVCYVDHAHVTALLAEPNKQRTIDINTLVGPPICYPNETFCFTSGSADANQLNRRTERTAAAGDTATCDEYTAATVNWETLARLAIDDPGAPIDNTLQTMQSNMLELMLHAVDERQRAASTATIEHARPLAIGPLARVGRGLEPYAQLRETLLSTCSAADGTLDDMLLYQHGDECYTNMREYTSRPLERLRLYKVRRCACGARDAARQRVRVVRPGARSKIGYRCTECGRSTVASVQMTPDLRALKRRAHLPDLAPVPTLQLHDASIDVPSVALDAVRSDTRLQPQQPIVDTDVAIDRALKRQKRK